MDSQTNTYRSSAGAPIAF